MKPKGHNLSVSPELRLLLLDCNDHCYPECCQSDAFTIEDRNVKNWIQSQHTDRSNSLLTEISDIISSLQEVEGPVVFEVRDIESTWKLDEALYFFSELKEVLFNVLGKPAT